MWPVMHKIVMFLVFEMCFQSSQQKATGSFNEAARYKGKHSHQESCNTPPRKAVSREALGEDTLSSPSGSVCLTHTLA